MQRAFKMVKTIGTRLLAMLNDQTMTDVTFIVQGTEVKGHRNVVSSVGGPLEALVQTKKKRVVISEEISLKAFREVLRFIYTDGCNVNNDNIFELLYAAKTFQLEDLMEFCGKKLASLLTARNVAAYTVQALHFDVKEYLRICKDYFRMNFLEVMGTKKFCDFSSEILTELIRDNEIDWSNTILFIACLEWAKYDCKWKNLEPTTTNIRTSLGEVLTEIKFSDMSRNDFLSIVAPTEILSDEEVGRIIKDWPKGKKQDQPPRKLDAKAQKRNTAFQMPKEVIVKVTVETYKKPFRDGNIPNFVVLSLPLSTRICEVKEMHIFYGGLEQCPPNKFTLEHNGMKLADDTTLGSIYSPGEYFVLKLHSVTFKLAIKEKKWPWALIPVINTNAVREFTFTRDDYYSNESWLSIMQRQQRLRVPLNTIGFDNWLWIKLPGDTISIYFYDYATFIIMVILCIIFIGLLRALLYTDEFWFSIMVGAFLFAVIH